MARTVIPLVLLLTAASCSMASLEPFATTERGFFHNGADRLHYALDLPDGVDRPPVIVLGHSSGRDTADINARFALPLVQSGFAVLRFDKRGVGKSDGVYSKSFANLQVLGDDLVAAVEFVHEDPRLDATRIGLMGHSQAGWVVPHAAARSQHVAFVILLAGPAVTAQQHNYWDAMADDDALSIDDLEERLASFEPEAPDHDPLPDLEAMQVPGLWIFGEQDRIIPSRSSAQILEGLVQSARKAFTVIIYPDAGHSLDMNYWPDLFAWYGQTIGARP